MRILSIAIILLVGSAMLWFASSTWGIGYDPDSIIYEDVAENWIAGYGIARFDFDTGERYPMTNFPPFYPMTLAILSQIFGTVADSARILNTAMWGVLWLLIYGWIRRGHQTHWIGWSVASITLINLWILQVFGTSWSEPLFIVLGVSGLWLIFSYIESWNWRHLIIASVLFACAILTRYAGVTVVAATGMMFLLATDKLWRERIQSIVVLGVISGLPLLVWLLRNISVRGDVANRNVGFTLVGLPQLEMAIQTLGAWIIPIPDFTVSVIILIIVGALLGWTYRFANQQQADTGISIMRWWVVIYVPFIIASFTFLDPRIPFNYRILLPSYIGLVIVIGRWLTLHWRILPRYVRSIWLVFAMVLLFINGLLGSNWSVIIGRNGQQYSDAKLQQSAIIHELRDNSTDITFYTNNHFLFHYLTDKPAYRLPPPETSKIVEWTDQLTDDESIQIVFFSVISQGGWETIEQVESLLPVEVIDSSDVVTLYKLTLSRR